MWIPASAKYPHLAGESCSPSLSPFKVAGKLLALLVPSSPTLKSSGGTCVWALLPGCAAARRSDPLMSLPDP